MLQTRLFSQYVFSCLVMLMERCYRLLHQHWRNQLAKLEFLTATSVRFLANAWLNKVPLAGMVFPPTKRMSVPVISNYLEGMPQSSAVRVDHDGSCSSY
jgi:lysophospholipid acyltransferase (LPLAT)-like uncharacterized protein